MMILLDKLLRWICVSLLADVILAGDPTSAPSLSPNSVSIISTIAGTGTGSYSGDGSEATSATILFPHGIDIDSSGNVYFSDNPNNRVRMITTATGIITTYAGTGASSFSGDNGAASSAAVYYPNGLSIDSSGINLHIISPTENIFITPFLDNVYISDYANCRIRKVEASTSIITTIAGSGMTMDSYSGDNGQATSADLNNPSGVALDSSG
jgi:sugar lactone lactonase YvrE